LHEKHKNSIILERKNNLRTRKIAETPGCTLFLAETPGCTLFPAIMANGYNDEM
jgi:hypothetical protein